MPASTLTAKKKAATSNKNGATVGCQTVLSNINAKAILHPPALPVINGMNHTDFGNILNHTNPTVIAAKPDDIWYVGDAAERLRLRDFWLQLSEEDRSALVKLEKEAVLKKVRDQQKQTCSCHVCGRRRMVLGEELEVLYDAYYNELQQFANDHSSGNTSKPHPHRVSYHRHIDDVMADIDDEDCDDESDSSGILEFGTSLTVKGGILTVADDFLKNDGQKFLNLMEQLSQRRLQSTNDDEDDFAPTGSPADRGYDDYEDDEDDEYDDEDQDHLTEQQRMEEGRRMFQIFAAKMFEQRVLAAYHEKLSQERQERLIEELEAEEREILHKEKAKQESKEKKRAQKEKEEEKARLEEEQRCALELELERKAEEERQRLVAEQIKREAELKAQQMAEDKARRDAEKARKNEERRKQKEIEEENRKQRQREASEKSLQERERQRLDKLEKQEKKHRERERKEEEAAAAAAAAAAIASVEVNARVERTERSEQMMKADKSLLVGGRQTAASGTVASGHALPPPSPLSSLSSLSSSLPSSTAQVAAAVVVHPLPRKPVAAAATHHHHYYTNQPQQPQRQLHPPVRSTLRPVPPRPATGVVNTSAASTTNTLTANSTITTAPQAITALHTPFHDHPNNVHDAVLTTHLPNQLSRLLSGPLSEESLPRSYDGLERLLVPVPAPAPMSMSLNDKVDTISLPKAAMRPMPIQRPIVAHNTTTHTTGTATTTATIKATSTDATASHISHVWAATAGATRPNTISAFAYGVPFDLLSGLDEKTEDSPLFSHNGISNLGVIGAEKPHAHQHYQQPLHHLQQTIQQQPIQQHHLHLPQQPQPQQRRGSNRTFATEQAIDDPPFSTNAPMWKPPLSIAATHTVSTVSGINSLIEESGSGDLLLKANAPPGLSGSIGLEHTRATSGLGLMMSATPLLRSNVPLDQPAFLSTMREPAILGNRGWDAHSQQRLHSPAFGPGFSHRIVTGGLGSVGSHVHYGSTQPLASSAASTAIGAPPRPPSPTIYHPSFHTHGESLHMGADRFKPSLPGHTYIAPSNAVSQPWHTTLAGSTALEESSEAWPAFL
ncbi:hypothetical protein BSLG_006432 [Batrachochytrium salamandrivorans]|nr:hypothetical protein BSLG_006432 [Batrachochytrium salamandrivorans]